MFSSHSLRKPGASAVRNTFASGDTHRPLSSDALRTGIDILNRYRGHNDVQLIPTKDINLVVPVELGATAHRIIKSDYGPDTANLGLNPSSESALASRGMKINYTVASYIPAAYSTYWTLVAKDRAAKAWKMGWGWKPRVQEDDTKRSAGTLQFVGSTYFRPIALGWDWAFGSQGNNAAI